MSISAVAPQAPALIPTVATSTPKAAPAVTSTPQATPTPPPANSNLGKNVNTTA